jgi:hypothetical protein
MCFRTSTKEAPINLVQSTDLSCRGLAVENPSTFAMTRLLMILGLTIVRIAVHTSTRQTRSILTMAADASDRPSDWGVFELASTSSLEGRETELGRLLGIVAQVLTPAAKVDLVLRAPDPGALSKLQTRLGRLRRERDLSPRLPAMESLREFQAADTDSVSFVVARLSLEAIAEAGDVAHSWPRMWSFLAIGLQDGPTVDEVAVRLFSSSDSSEMALLCGVLSLAKESSVVCAMTFGRFDDRECGVLLAAPIGIMGEVSEAVLLNCPDLALRNSIFDG